MLYYVQLSNIILTLYCHKTPIINYIINYRIIQFITLNTRIRTIYVKYLRITYVMQTATGSDKNNILESNIIIARMENILKLSPEHSISMSLLLVLITLLKR